MNTHKEPPFFHYPMRGWGVVAVFLVIAPPVQAVVEVLRLHVWQGGRQLLVEFMDVLWNTALPATVPAYSVYMPLAVVAGFWSAYRPARGGALTIGGAIGRMVVVGLGFELLFQAIVLLSGGNWLSEAMAATRLFQWIFSGWACWLVAKMFKLDMPVQEKTG